MVWLNRAPPLTAFELQGVVWEGSHRVFSGGDLTRSWGNLLPHPFPSPELFPWSTLPTLVFEGEVGKGGGWTVPGGDVSRSLAEHYPSPFPSPDDHSLPVLSAISSACSNSGHQVMGGCVRRGWLGSPWGRSHHILGEVKPRRYSFPWQWLSYSWSTGKPPSMGNRRRRWLGGFGERDAATSLGEVKPRGYSFPRHWLFIPLGAIKFKIMVPWGAQSKEWGAQSKEEQKLK